MSAQPTNGALKFAIEGQPELEAALNQLAAEIHNKSGSGVRFADTRNIKVREENGIVSFDLFGMATERPGSASRTYPWQPSFFKEGTAESPIYKVRFNLGTVNNVPASNWNTAFTLSMADNVFHFVIITITTSNGRVTSVKLSVEAAAPTEDAVTKNVPPPSHKIVLGAVGKTSGKMIIFDNLEITATEVFREPVDSPALGAEPIARWWRWTRLPLSNES